MPRLHEHTTYDPDAEVLALVAKLEAEALDEDMVAVALERIITGLTSRQQLSVQLLAVDQNQRISDKRREYLRSGIKGVKPQLPGGSKVLPASLIPSRTH